jgi:hypothetical protein
MDGQSPGYPFLSFSAPLKTNTHNPPTSISRLSFAARGIHLQRPAMAKVLARVARRPYLASMQGEFRVFHSFAEGERADRAYYRSLTPSQRLDLLLELIQQWHADETAKGFERVYRVVKLHEG